VVLGVLAMICAVAYTGGPYPLGYHGFGDVLVLIFFGFAAVCGTVFVQLGQVPTVAWWAAVPVGTLATAILVVNNLRDRQGDAMVGKKTLAVRLGPVGTRVEYTLLVAAAYAIPLAGAIHYRHAALILPAASLPLAIPLVTQLWRRDGADLNPCLPATARLLLVFSLLWAGAILWAAS